jgi:phosphatidylserine/phosphatidylglycerophosphate/cardiolipin synthase-like enzyme
MVLYPIEAVDGDMDKASVPQLITRHQAFRELVMNRVRQSGREILIDVHTLEFDGFGQPLLSELEYACQRGLRVCCLLDAEGSRHFISSHPALLTLLETTFRVRDGNHGRGNSIILDRQLAIVGQHNLCEPVPPSQASPDSEVEGSRVSMLISMNEAAVLADKFDTDWERSSPYGG